MPLEPENQRLLTSAQGFLELGLPLEANEEIESIDPDVRHVPEVLAVRVSIYRALEKWGLMQTVAKKLALYDPDEPKWTLARLRGFAQAARAFSLTRVPPKGVGLHYTKGDFVQLLRSAARR